MSIVPFTMSPYSFANASASSFGGSFASASASSFGGSFASAFAGGMGSPFSSAFASAGHNNILPMGRFRHRKPHQCSPCSSMGNLNNLMSPISQFSGLSPLSSFSPNTYQFGIASPIYTQPTASFTNHVSDMFRPIISTHYDVHRFKNRDIYLPIQYNQPVNQYLPNQQYTMPSQQYTLPAINQYPQQGYGYARPV